MMSVFIYLDQNQVPTGVQRFETMPGVDITVPPGVLYVEDASVLPPDTEIVSNWRMRAGVLTNVGPNPGPSYRWDIISETWVPDIPKAKADKWTQLKTTRDQKESGGFTWDTSAFDSDPMSQIRIQGGVSLAQMALANNQPFSIDWTLQNNTVRTLNATEMIGVGLALASHVTNLHGIGRILKQQVDAASTLQEVEAVQWPG